MAEAESSQEELQVVMVGEANVGKSAVTMQFLKGFFLEDYDPTVDDKYIKQMDIDGVTYSLEIVDTAGQEQYSGLRDKYLRSGDGFILTYSVADRNSFENIPQLYKQILRAKQIESDDADSVPCVLIANKADLDPDDRVPMEEGQSLAEKLKVGFFETSAKLRDNIDESYEEIVRRIRQCSTKVKDKPAAKTKPEKKKLGLGGLLKKIGGKK